jgi:hypothetical protein
LTGCSATPKIYTMPPSKLEGIRAEVKTVGVVLVEGSAETEVAMPAIGVWGGFKRGIYLGATVPILIGMASPVPGGTVIGAMAAPFTAVAGGVYGAFNSVPAQQVEAAEAMLTDAAAEIRKIGLPRQFFDEVVRLGNARTGLEFVALPDIQPAGPGNGIEYNQADMPGVDAILELTHEKSGLRGINSIDPPSNTFIQMRSRLIAVEDNKTLLDEIIYCSSDEERTFTDWTQKNGQLFIDEFRTCVPELAEKIVDDFFLVYPIASR